MKLTRRNALIGMGTVAAGAGVIGGTGAFTSVEADRTVSVQTAGDSGAALQLTEASDAPSADEEDGDDNESYIVEGDNNDDTLSVSMPDLNLEAVTKLTPLINIANNGGETVSISVSFADGDSDITWISAINTPATIGAGETDDFGLEFDTTGGDGPDPDPDTETNYTMTITATATDDSS